MTHRSSTDFVEALRHDTAEAWRLFVDRYTPAMLAAIERAGITDHDEAMEIYTLVSERLSARQCAALRRWDASKGSLESWLAVVMRRAVVDWIRSRAGRRRLFGVVKGLAPFEQRVFELYYWRQVMPTDLAQQLSIEQRREVSLADVLDALATIDAVLTERHRGDLLSLAARARPSSIEGDRDAQERATSEPDPEQALQLTRLRQQLEAALATLSDEDAAIFQLRYDEGLTLREIARLLRLEELDAARFTDIVTRVRRALQ